ncbi:MAG: tyrosine--tRNA ligase [Elusimicrobia bacterium]|nr:tyrosine--tRNA ligase [Elusimicrobiota bacterium]
MTPELLSLLRGVVSVTTEEELRKKLFLNRPLRVKLGVDPTTRDLHLGHTVPLRKMRAFQDLGHTGVLIIGDFTAGIGDPSGRDETRPVLSKEEIKDNAETYRDQAYRILDPAKTELRFNREWLEPFVAGGEFLRYLPKVTLARLTEREDFKARMGRGDPITMLEIFYPVFQGYDSVAVKADIEIGGSDQLFNLLFGRDMQRDYGQEPQVTMTFPLLVGTDGVKKMSKTYKNAVALQDEPKEMFGKAMSISDELMLSWAEQLTELDLGVFKKMHPMEAKKLLAQTITAGFYTKERAEAALDDFIRVHSEGELPAHMPEFRLPKDKKLFLSQVIQLSGLAPSRKEAQRKIAEGAVRLSSAVVKEDKVLEVTTPTVLTFGRRGFLKVIPSN